MFGYRVPRSDQAMLISGKKNPATSGAEGKPTPSPTMMPRVVIGHGAWVMPGFRRVDFMGLELHKVDIDEKCRSKEGILLHLIATAAFKVQNTIPAVYAASQRFLHEQGRDDMENRTKGIVASHLRSVVATLTAVEIHNNREALVDAIMRTSGPEMSTLGLTVDSLAIEHLDDCDIGYYDNLAAETLAEAEKNAVIARAKAKQEAAGKEQEAERLVNDQLRDTALRKADNKAQTDKANAEAEAAGQLAQADVDQQVLQRQQAVADTNAELVQKQLVAEQIKPAEAQARAQRIAADAQTGVAQAAAARAEHEAAALKTKQVQAAHAAAEQARLEAEAARDAAKFTAEATEAQGQANAAKRQAEGQAEAAAQRAALMAEADGRKAMLMGEAEGEKAKAEAYAANEGAQLRMAEINVRPQIAEAAARALGLDGANLTILDGPDGLTKTIAALAPVIATFGEIFNQARNGQASNGHGPAEATDIDKALREVHGPDDIVGFGVESSR